MRFLAFCSFLCFSFSAFAQQIKYLDKNRNLLPDSTSASFYTKIYKNPNTPEGLVRMYYMDGVKISEHQYSNFEQGIHGGLTRTWYPNGQVKHEILYQDNAFHGSLKTYYANGQLRRSEYYQFGQLREGKCYTKNGSDTACSAFQTLPKFPGGEVNLMKYIHNNIAKPLRFSKWTAGLVIVSFMVTSDGKIADIVIRKGLSEWQNNEVKRVLRSMPAWIPGQQEGEKIPLQYLLPVRFVGQ